MEFQSENIIISSVNRVTLLGVHIDSRLVYDDSPCLSFDELLRKDKSVIIHQRNLQFLATEIFQVKNGVSTGLTEDTFQFVNKPYDLRYNNIPLIKRNWTVFCGTESFLWLQKFGN